MGIMHTGFLTFARKVSDWEKKKSLKNWEKKLEEELLFMLFFGS
jgi:hypothetical protein